MKRSKPQKLELEPEAAAWVTRVVDEAAKIRLPELFGESRSGVLHSIVDRGGVSVVAIATANLAEAELVALMRYRLAQYLATDFADGRVAYEQRLEHEPLDAVSADDIHIVAGSPETGELFCYAVIEAPPAASAGTRLADRDRPLFPVEHVHGWGIYNRLRILPELPLAKIRELGRFVKNQRLPPIADASVRAPVEVFLTACRLITGRLATEVDGLIGDFEENIVKQNLDFFHLPLVVIHGTIPHLAEGMLLSPRYQYRTVYPFACLRADGVHALSRLDAIDHALAQPGTLGLIELMRARGESASARSSLGPPDGLAPLSEASVPQEGVSMEARRELIAAGSHLRRVSAFDGLSDAEAAILASCLEEIEAQTGETIVRQGDPGDALYVIDEGEAEVVLRLRDGAPRAIGRLGPGDYFGEIAIITGGERIADVVAATPMVLRRLSKDDYVRYLADVAEVRHELTATGIARASAAARDAQGDQPRQ